MFEIIDVILIVIAMESIIGLTKYLGKKPYINYIKSFFILLTFIFLMWTVMVLVSGLLVGDFNARDWFNSIFFWSGIFITLICNIIVMIIRKYGDTTK